MALAACSLCLDPPTPSISLAISLAAETGYTMTHKLNPDTRIQIAANASQLRQFRLSGGRLDH
jgi:hypothetical protein